MLPYAKIIVIDTIAQIAWHNMERLPEVGDWFGSLFEHYRLHLSDKGLIDSDLIAWMTSSAGELSLQEHLPVIEVLYEKGAVSKDIIGKWAEVVELFEAPRDEADLNPLPKNISEAYDELYFERKKIRQLSEKDKKEMDDLAKDPYAQKMLGFLTQSEAGDTEKKPIDALPLPPAQSTPKGNTKIGRNQPCPCQSGRKYKHCCGKK